LCRNLANHGLLDIYVRIFFIILYVRMFIHAILLVQQVICPSIARYVLYIVTSTNST